MSALTDDEFQRLQDVAAALIPGRAPSPAASDVPDLQALLEVAVRAIGRELDDLRAAIAIVPNEPDLAALRSYAEAHPLPFELLSAVVAGAYFMSPLVLASIGYPTGPRVAPPFDLAADELSSGILEPVIARGSRVRMPN